MLTTRDPAHRLWRSHVIIRRLTAIIVAVALASGSLLVTSQSASAALPSPSGLSSTGDSVGGIGLSWAGVAGASAYRVQIASDSGFSSSSIIWTQKTYGLDWFPQLALKAVTADTVFWRVAAYATGTADSTLGPDSDAIPLSLAHLAAPVNLSPGNSVTPEVIQYPTAVAFHWDPIPGAISYTLEYSSGTLGSADGLTAPAVTVTASSYAPTAPLARKAVDGSTITWSWRVRANYYNGTTGRRAADIRLLFRPSILLDRMGRGPDGHQSA